MNLEQNRQCVLVTNLKHTEGYAVQAPSFPILFHRPFFKLGKLNVNFDSLSLK